MQLQLLGSTIRSTRLARKPSSQGTLIALVSLILQNTALAILLKLSFREGTQPYAPSTAVLCTEVLKLSLSLLAVARSSPSQITAAVSQIGKQKALFLPALLYVLQSNLLFFSSKRLPPVVYIVCSQSKIITTAGFSRFILGTRLHNSQYASLVFLVLGILLVQVPDTNFRASKNIGGSTAGILAIMLASLTSGLAGVLLEKLYKDPGISKELEHTIWTRNVQLSLISIPFALSGVFIQAQEQVFDGIFFNGYDYVVLSVIALQAVGGIIISFVLKFANSIMKCMAIAVSICCCAIYSVYSNELKVTAKLVTGIFLVNVSVLAFSLRRPRERLQKPSRADVQVLFQKQFEGEISISGI